MSTNSDVKYPVGQFESPATINARQRQEWIDQIKKLPAEIRSVVGSLTEAQLDRPYREGGWTGRQVVHHLADSHMNSYIRFRWALTEEFPLVKTYDEALWAELPDASKGPVEISLSLLEALHARWVMLLESMNDTQYARELIHPLLGELKLDWMLGLYAWHGRHHGGHLRSLQGR